MELLLEDGRIDPTLEDPIGMTVLGGAIATGNAKIVEMLLADGRVDPNWRDHHLERPLHRAVKEQRVEVVKVLLKDPRVRRDRRDLFRRKLSSLATDTGNTELMELFPAKHVDTGPPCKTDTQKRQKHPSRKKASTCMRELRQL